MRTVIVTLFALLLASCAVTRHIEEGEQLYTGIEKIEILGAKEYARDAAGAEALEEIKAALACPPNGSIAGSSTLRGFPVGLWWYNALHNSKSKVGRWFFETFGDSPVLISQVNPELRAQVAGNILEQFGYFNGEVTEEVVTDKKNPKKAKISYRVTLNEPCRYGTIEYRGYTGEAATLIKESRRSRLIKEGQQFSAQALSNERERINTLLRNNGYYYHRPTFTRILADTTRTPLHADLHIEPQKGLAAALGRQYIIGDINIAILKSDSYTSRGARDTLKHRNISYIYDSPKLPVRPGAILRNISIRSGEKYSQEEQQNSLDRLSRMNIFGSTAFNFVPRSESDTLDLNITARLDKPYDFTFELNVTSKSNSQIGPGSEISLSKKNIFRGGELLKLSLRGSYEWQTDDKVKGSNSLINSWETGADLSLTAPRIYAPFIPRSYLRAKGSTAVRLYADRMNRSGFFRIVHVGGEFTYHIDHKSTTKHTVSPFRLTFDMLRHTTEKFDAIVAENRALQNSFRDQFIPAMQYTFTYDNVNTGHRNKSRVEVSLTSAGNITSLVLCAFGKKWSEKNKKLFQNPYAQFAKLTAELRQLYRIDRNNYIATRLMTGILHSYGNAEYAPYSEQFYIGGANSLRAFTVRSVGPGSFRPATDTRYSYLDETGTLKLEANVEYRFKVVGKLHGALFVDAGNIWLTKNEESRPGGKITLKDFPRQIALNTGAGIRYDLDILVIRLDFGMGLHAPYKTSRRGYFNLSPLGDGFAWHFAIGYPF